MGHEDRVVMVERRIRTVTHGRARHMGDRIVAGQLDHMLVACHRAVCGEREGLVGRTCPHPREHMRHRAPLMVAALRADVMECAAIGHVDFHALVEPRGGWPVFENGDLGAFLDTHDVVQHRIRGLVAVQVDEADGSGHLRGGADHDTVGREPGIQCGKRPFDRVLTTRLKHAEKIARPVDVLFQSIRKAFDFNAFHREVVGLIRVEHTVNENQLEPVDIRV